MCGGFIWAKDSAYKFKTQIHFSTKNLKIKMAAFVFTFFIQTVIMQTVYKEELKMKTKRLNKKYPAFVLFTLHSSSFIF
jgi:hypothetical protein